MSIKKWVMVLGIAGAVLLLTGVWGNGTEWSPRNPLQRLPVVRVLLQEEVPWLSEGLRVLHRGFDISCVIIRKAG